VSGWRLTVPSSGRSAAARSVREREAVKGYLEELEFADAQEEVVIDPGAVASAREKLRQHPEAEAGFMRTPNGKSPAYNVQTAVDAEHALIVAEQVTDQATDNRSLQPMAEATQAAVGEPTMNVVADAGYSNGKQAEACEAKGIVPHVPANRAVNNQGDGTLFDRKEFSYQPESDSFGVQLARRSPANSFRAKTAPSTTPVNRKSAELRPQVTLHGGCTTVRIPASA
jgi:Transposase DDE domain